MVPAPRDRLFKEATIAYIQCDNTVESTFLDYWTDLIANYVDN